MEIRFLVAAVVLFAVLIVWQVRFCRTAGRAQREIRRAGRSWRDVSAKDRPDMTSQEEGNIGPKLLVRIKQDIEARISTGGQPDWQTYSQWLERFVRAQLEVIRQQANSALVLGILGTIVLAVVHFVGVAEIQEVPDWPLEWPLRWAILITLGSSGIGMLNHLFISLRNLRLAERESDDFLDVAEGLIRSLAAGLARPSLPDDAVLAEPINQLSAGVLGLRTSMERQTETISVILKDQRSLVEKSGELYGIHTDKVADALGQHSEQLAQLFEELHELPGMIRGAIETVPALLAQEVIKGQRYVQDIRDVLDGRVRDVKDAVQTGHVQILQSTKNNQEDLVDHLQQHVESLGSLVEKSGKLYGIHADKVVDALGKHSGQLTQEVIKVQRFVQDIRDVLGGGVRDLRDAVHSGHEQIAQSAKKSQDDLVDHLQRHVETLGEAVRDTRLEVTEIGGLLENASFKLREQLKEGLDDMRRYFVSNTDKIVKEIFKEHHKRSTELVWEPLEKLGQELGIVANNVPNAADRFRDSVGTAAQKLAHLPDDFATVQARLKEITDNLSGSQTAFFDTLKRVETSTIVVTQRAQQLHDQVGESVSRLVQLLERLISESS